MYIEKLLGLKVIIDPKGAASLATNLGWTQQLETHIALPEGMESSDMVNYVAERLARIDFLPYLNTCGMEELAGVLTDTWNKLRTSFISELEPTLCKYESEGWDKSINWVYVLPIEGQVIKHSPYFKLVLEPYPVSNYYLDHQPSNDGTVPTYGEESPSWKNYSTDYTVVENGCVEGE